ncbi:MAG: helix-turn-helix domain-containing protein [Peptostreptococcaceae bacterium]
MNNLNEMLADFYNTLNIPTSFIDDNLKIVSQIGHNTDTHSVINSTTIYKDIKDNILSVIKLTYFDNIHFIVIPTLNSKYLSGYFIVGPFKSKYICSELDIPFKPVTCLDYISYILDDMIVRKFNSLDNSNIYIQKSIEYIHSNYDLDLKIGDICDYLNINKSYFCSIFKKETGYTFTTYLNKFRIEKSKELLKSSDLSILNIALQIGFNNHNYFTTTFKKFTGKNPLQYKKNHIN